MNEIMQQKQIIMCGSDLSVRGGIVSVIKNYLSYSNWDPYNIKYIPTHVETGKVKAILCYAKGFIKVLFTAATKKTDIVYVHTSERGSFYRKSLLVRFLRLFGCKTIMHHHGAEFDQFYNNSPTLCKKYINKTLRLVDLNIVLSNRLVKMITDKSPDAKVKVLYNAVKTYSTNQYNENSTGVLFLGRLGNRKGTYDLLKAIKSLDHKLDKNIVFYLCGDGEVEEVKEWVKKENIEHRIAHIGWIGQEQKDEILKNTMINILPSYNEGLPMTILETMAYGIPNISTKIASIPEVLFDAENGYLIEPGDIEALETKLFSLCTDASLRKRFSEKSWQDITQRFALNNHIELLQKYMGDL